MSQAHPLGEPAHLKPNKGDSNSMTSSTKVVLIGAAMLLITASSYGQAPAFSPVVITGNSNNYSLALSGYNFGSNVCNGSGDCANFRIGNPTCNKTNPGGCEAGYLGDAYTVDFNSWLPNAINVNGYTVGKPCDAIEVGAWNSQNNQADGVAWAGNIPGTNCGTPQINSVVFSGSGANLHITIYGKGFGKAPSGIPCNNCDTEFLRFGDYAYHSFTGACGVCFYAGNSTSGGSNSITLNYKSWSNTKIVLTGFAGTYGQNGMAVSSGDPVTIDVWSTNATGLLATAWSGRLPSAVPAHQANRLTSGRTGLWRSEATTLASSWASGRGAPEPGHRRSEATTKLPAKAHRPSQINLARGNKKIGAAFRRPLFLLTTDN
jgi:hypothetical protein